MQCYLLSGEVYYINVCGPIVNHYAYGISCKSIVSTWWYNANAKIKLVLSVSIREVSFKC